MDFHFCPNCFNKTFHNRQCSKCGYTGEGEDNEEGISVGTVLNNRYYIGRILGSGGFGITYIAYDLINQKRCAIKEFFPMGIVVRDADKKRVNVPTSKNLPEFKHGVKRFIEESETLETLGGLDGVVHIMDNFETNGTAYYVMEYLDGVTVKQLIKSSPDGIDADTANQIIIEAGKTLDAIHKHKGYLHRDISPENIMVLRSDKEIERVVIIDFGSAKDYFHRSNTKFTITLKHGFAPLEQYTTTARQGPYTDLYALASTYYFMLTRTMVPTAPERLSGADYPKLSSCGKGISNEISDAVDNALMIKSIDRTKTVLEFIEVIEREYHKNKTTVTDYTKQLSLNAIPDFFKGVPESKTKDISIKGSEKIKPISNNVPYVKIMIDNRTVYDSAITPDINITIGRSRKKSRVVIEGDIISGKHCTVMYDSNQKSFYITDHSLNGTYVNNKKIEQEITYHVNGYDSIYLASNRYVLKLEVR